MKSILQINFQFGTFESNDSSFLIDLLINGIGAFIGILGAYYIYLLSIKHLRVDRLKYFASLINSVIPSAQRQSGYSIEYSQTIANNPFTLEQLKLEANRDFKRLADKLDQEAVYHAYLKKYKRKQNSYQKFQAIYSYIDYIDFLIEQLISSNEKVLIGIWERKKNYANEFRVLKEKVEVLVLDKTFQQSQAGQHQHLDKCLHDYYKNNPPGENLVHSQSSLVVPVRQYIMQHAVVNATNTELMLLLNNLENIYSGIGQAAKFASREYQETGECLKKAADKLQAETVELRKDFKI